MKYPYATCTALSLLSSFAFAGTSVVDGGLSSSTANNSGFANARRPISNPTLFDLALPGTNLHPIFIQHALPNQLNTTLGNLPVGGDVQLYALQFEIALNDRLSIVATKDGYVDINPDATLSEQSGFANLGAGLKYAFILDPASGTAVSGTATLELPTGNSDVLQGEGKGLLNLILSGLKLDGPWQYAGAIGLQAPFSNEQSTEGWLSTHVSYEVCKRFIPLVELNWFHVIDSGDGSGNYPSQVGGAVPGVIEFEGGDLFNLGAVHGGNNPDFVSAAFGFRSNLTDNIDFGAAYEIPLTKEENSLMESRITLDLVWKF
jgi:hypothetical protein